MSKFISLYRFYVEQYYETGFRILFSGIAVELLSKLYEKFLRQEEIVPLELAQENEVYYEAGEKYQTEKRDKIMVAKAAYALKLISIVN